MRYFTVLFLSLVTALGGSAIAQAAPPPSVHIRWHASTIYQWDASPSQDGSAMYPATNVTAVFVRCPAGDYQLDATLTQSGQQMSWATLGRGAGEITCSGHQRRFVLRWPFAGTSLHPGRAVATFALHRAVCDDGLCTTEPRATVAKRAVVWIPAGS
jgi:hypothetical protein